MMFHTQLPYSVKIFGLKLKDGKVSVYCRIILKRIKVDIALGIKQEAIHWDENTKRFDPKLQFNLHLNHLINQVDSKVYDCYMQLKGKGITPTAALIKKAFLGKEIITDKPLLTDYVDEVIQKLKKLPEEYSIGCLVHYYYMQKSLIEFLTYRKITDITLDKWKRSHFEDYLEFLLMRHTILPNKKQIQRATIRTHVVKLKAIINRAIKAELVEHDPTRGLKIPIGSKPREYLTNDELKQLETSSLGENLSLDRVRDVFLFSVYTGLRYCDAIALLKTSVIVSENGDYFIRIIQKKTKEPLYRPLLMQAVCISKKYAEYNSEYVLPQISNQKLNTYLKTIADLCGISKRLSHHMARHTFATTILLESGIDIKTASYFLGHTSVKSTEVYGKISDTRALDVVKEINTKFQIASVLSPLQK